MTTPDLNTTRFEYGGLGWLANVIHPNGDRVEFRFNREGWVLTYTNEKGEVHERVSDRTGRLVQERFFNGALRKYKLDPAGFVVKMEETSGITELERNPCGQVVKYIAPDGSEATYDYDVRGEFVGATLPEGKLTIQRDAAGGIVHERHTIGGRSYELANVFDPGGCRTALTTSLSHEMRFLRDAVGEVSELRDANGSVVQVQRSASGLPLMRKFSRGGSVVDTYDAASRLTRRQVVRAGSRPATGEPEWLGSAPPGTVYKSYEYSPVDEITSVTTAADGTTEFEYDVRRHVRKRRHGGAEETWGVDAVGNYFETGPASLARSYLEGGRVAARGATEYRWDDRGYLIEKRRTGADGSVERSTYEWNGRNLLAAVALPDGRRVEFDYDAFARRIARRVVRPRSTGERDVLEAKHYLWDGAALLHEIDVTDTAASLRLTYLFEDEMAVSPAAHREAGSDWVHYVGDVNGAPDELVDAAGNLVGRVSRSTFGAASPVAGSAATTAFRAPGQLSDEEVGLHYNRYRYYDPEVGHYISPDPIGPEGGTNLYTFGPNPIGWFDLLGWQHCMTGSVTRPDPNDPTGPPIPVPIPGNGSYQSGQRPPPDTQYANPQNPNNNTERQFIRDCQTYQAQNGPNSLRGTTATLNGQYPPCPQCHRALRAMADQSGMAVNYSWNGQTIHYGPGTGAIGSGGPPTATGTQAGALVGTGAPGNQGAYAMTPDPNRVNGYSYNNYGAGANNRNPDGTYNTNTAMGAYGQQRDDVREQGTAPPPGRQPPPGQGG